MKNFNLNSTQIQLRNEVCKLQTTIGEMRDCQSQIQKIDMDDSMAGFFVALGLVATFVFGYMMGKL